MPLASPAVILQEVSEGNLGDKGKPFNDLILSIQKSSVRIVNPVQISSLLARKRRFLFNFSAGSCTIVCGLRGLGLSTQAVYTNICSDSDRWG